VGTRQDITSNQRAQIAIEVLSPHRLHGVVLRLACKHGISRQTIYAIAEAGRQVLEAYLVPGAHGPQAGEGAKQKPV
jgi:hypothetical protein